MCTTSYQGHFGVSKVGKFLIFESVNFPVFEITLKMSEIFLADFRLPKIRNSLVFFLEEKKKLIKNF